MRNRKTQSIAFGVALLFILSTIAAYADDCCAAASRSQWCGAFAADHSKHLCWYGHPFVSKPAQDASGRGPRHETAAPCFVHCFSHPLIRSTDCNWTGRAVCGDTRRAAADVSLAGFLSLVAYTSDYVSRSPMYCRIAMMQAVNKSRSSVPMVGIFI
jgi:hypothetical protein